MSKSLIRIYLSGSIKKGRIDTRDEGAFWTEEHECIIKNLLGRHVELLNPAKSPISRNDYFVNYGCDLYLIDVSDVILADLREERGIGVGAELMYAQQIGKPVITWLPLNSTYRREFVADVFGEDLHDWIYPFAYSLSDHIVDNLHDACELIKRAGIHNLRKDRNKTITAALSKFKGDYGAWIKQYE